MTQQCHESDRSESMSGRKRYRVKGEMVRDLRELRFMSPEELAKEAGVSESTIRRMEGEKTAPHRPNIRKIAKALGVEVGDIIEFVDSKLESLGPSAEEA